MADSDKTVYVCKRIQPGLREALSREMDVLCIRIPVYHKLLYKLCIADDAVKREALRAGIAGLIEAIASGLNEYQGVVRSIELRLNLNLEVRGEGRRCTPRDAEALLSDARELLSFIASPGSAYPHAIKKRAREALEKLEKAAAIIRECG